MKYENIIADQVYASEENYTYLEQQGQKAYIKPADHEVRKKKKFKNDRYRIENMHYDEEKDCYRQYENRKIGLSQVMAKQKEKAEQLIASDDGIILRMNRSIQVEGAFGVLKEDSAFRRFLTGGKHKTQTQFLLLSFAFNIQKLCNRLNFGRFHMPLFEKMIA